MADRDARQAAQGIARVADLLAFEVCSRHHRDGRADLLQRDAVTGVGRGGGRSQSVSRRGGLWRSGRLGKRRALHVEARQGDRLLRDGGVSGGEKCCEGEKGDWDDKSRSHGDDPAVEQATSTLSRGQCVMTTPEGDMTSRQRDRSDFETQTPRTTNSGDLQLLTVATTVVRSLARPVQVMGDSCRQVSWLAAQARHPAFPPDLPAVAYGGGARRSQLRGQPRVLTAFPFHQRALAGHDGPSRRIYNRIGQEVVNESIRCLDHLRMRCDAQVQVVLR